MGGTQAKSRGLVAAFATAAVLCGGAAYAADMDNMVTSAAAAGGLCAGFVRQLLRLLPHGLSAELERRHFLRHGGHGRHLPDPWHAVRPELPDRRKLPSWCWWRVCGRPERRIWSWSQRDEPIERRRQNQGTDCAGRLVVYFPERVGVRPVFAPLVQRAAGHAERHRPNADSGGFTVRLEPLGMAGGDECRRPQPASLWHGDLRPAERPQQ